MKDLLPQLQAASKHIKKNSDGKVPPVSDLNGKHTTIEMKPLRPEDKNMSTSCDEFFKAFEEVIDNIDTIENNNKKIRKLQIQVLSGTNQQQVDKDRAALDDLIESNKKFGVRVRNALKKEQDRLDDKALAAQKAGDGKRTAKEEHEMRLRRTQIAAHSRRFFDLWAEYNSQQVQSI